MVEVFVLIRRQSAETGLDAARVVPAVMASERTPLPADGQEPMARSLLIEIGAPRWWVSSSFMRTLVEALGPDPGYREGQRPAAAPTWRGCTGS
jgi:hypothetical protein